MASVFVLFLPLGLICLILSWEACLEFSLKLLFLLLSQKFIAAGKLPEISLSHWLFSWLGFCPKPQFIFLLWWEKRIKKNQVKINLSVFSILPVSPNNGILTRSHKVLVIKIFLLFLKLCPLKYFFRHQFKIGKILFYHWRKTPIKSIGFYLKWFLQFGNPFLRRGDFSITVLNPQTDNFLNAKFCFGKIIIYFKELFFFRFFQIRILVLSTVLHKKETVAFKGCDFLFQTVP